jgi:hypothetical protein
MVQSMDEYTKKIYALGASFFSSGFSEGALPKKLPPPVVTVAAASFFSGGLPNNPPAALD